MQLDYYTLNKTNEEECKRLLYDWLQNHDYCPDDIFDDLKLSFAWQYFPAFYYLINYDAKVTANVGYPAQHVNSNGQRVNHIQWRSFLKYLSGKVSVIAYAGKPTDKVVLELVSFAEIGNNNLIPVHVIDKDMDNLSKLFVSGINEQWENIGYSRAYNYVNSQGKASLPTSHVQNYYLNVDFELVSQFSFVIPIWQCVFVYNNEKYSVFFDGLNPLRFDGNVPIDKVRKDNVLYINLFGWIIGFSLLYFLYYLNEYYNIVELSGGKLFLFLITGTFLTWYIVKHKKSVIKNNSKKERANRLNQLQNKNS
ncbi:MAG: hypothetical protein ACOYLG_01130 [Chitinophagaceae bacterium]